MTETDDPITLNYIDKLYQTMGRMWELSNRIQLILTTLCLILLSVSVGVVSAEDKVSLGGLDLQLSLSVFLSSGALIVGFLAIGLLAAITTAQRMGWHIDHIYKQLGGQIVSQI